MDSLSRTADWIVGRPAWLVASALVALSLAKSGVVLWNWYELSPGLVENWGDPDNAFQANALLNAIAAGWSGAGMDPAGPVWLLLQGLLTVGSFAVVAGLVIARTSVARTYLPLAILLSTGVAAVLWREIGRYDALFIAGVALAVLAERRWLTWLGVVIAATSSPEQLLVGAVLMLLLVVLPAFRGFLPTATRLLVGALGMLIAVQVWFTVMGDPWKTRIGVVLAHFRGDDIAGISAYDTKQSFAQFTIEKAMVSLSAGPLLVWSYLGAATLLVVVLLLAERSWWRAIWMVSVITVIPIVVSVVAGEDRTRDLVLITLPVVLAIVMTGSSLVAELVADLAGGQARWLTWLAVAAALLPLVYFYLYAEEPFRFLKEVVIAWNNGAPIELDGGFR